MLKVLAALRAKLDTKTWSSSTRRSVRTLLHGAIALVSALPVIIPLIQGLVGDNMTEGMAATAGTLILWSATVSKIINALEDSGLIPAILKSGTTPSPKGGSVAPAPEAEADVEVDVEVDAESSVLDTVGELAVDVEADVEVEAEIDPAP